MSRHCILLLSLTALILGGCARVPFLEEDPIAPEDPETLFSLPADEAWERSLEWPPEQRPLIRLALLQHWLEQQQWDALSAWLPALDASRLDDTHASPLKHLQAQVLLHHEDAAAALNVLSGMPEEPSTLELKWRAYQQLGDTGNLLRIRLQQAALLDTATAREAGFRNVWYELTTHNRRQLQHWREQTNHSHWKGWLDLALLTLPDQRPLLSIHETLREWSLHYIDHPAAPWLPYVMDSLQALHPDIDRIAALIPVSGKLAPVGKAIRSGIEARMRGQIMDTPELQIYDTGDAGVDIAALYQQALNDGADRIIGPFNKDAVVQLAQGTPISTQTISLNYLDHPPRTPGQLFQFGLLPEDEAAQVAQRALQDGYRAALVFVPSSEWGRRLYQAFRQYFEAHGGVVRNHAFYLANAPDHTAQIKDALQLSESEERQRALEEVLGQEVIARPTRRQDVDMVFLASSPRNARLFKPQLDFYYAEDLPIYSTSHVYTGIPSPLQDQDLDGIMFCDAPLALQEDLQNALKQTAQTRTLPRFVALGADAYLLAMNLEYLKTRSSALIEGWTGDLSIHDGQRIFRGLLWARFEQGRAVLVDP